MNIYKQKVSVILLGCITSQQNRTLLNYHRYSIYDHLQNGSIILLGNSVGLNLYLKPFMKNYRKCCFLVLTMEVSLLLISCQFPLTKNDGPQKDIKDSKHTYEYTDFDKSHALTAIQLSYIFPESLNGLNRTSIKLDQKIGSASAFYGNHQYEISIIDDLRNDYSNTYIFDKKYRGMDQVKKGERKIKSVRDGYKTITTVQEEMRTTSIFFIYKNRYLFKITGTNNQTPYMVWRFLELNKFHKLPE